jgi:hypothetical protein
MLTGAVGGLNFDQEDTTDQHFVLLAQMDTPKLPSCWSITEQQSRFMVSYLMSNKRLLRRPRETTWIPPSSCFADGEHRGDQMATEGHGFQIGG